MDTSIICITLCCLFRNTVIGQMLVSHKDGVNITSSSQYSPIGERDIDNIIDGNNRTDASNCGCCGASDFELNPWYKVDLGQEYRIQRIHVLGRTDYGHFLYGMEIQLGTNETDGTVLPGVNTSDTDLRELDHTLTCPQLARFITLTLRNVKTYFVVCELYVYAEYQTGNYGINCEQRCGICLDGDGRDIHLDTSSRSETAISLPVFIGSLCAVVVVNTTIVLALLFYRKRLNNETHHAANSEAVSIELPNIPSNYEALTFDNPNGESIYTEINMRS